jgi:predicted SAM-dependent methyltransferase
MSASAALSQRPHVLELGCGGTKRVPEPVGIDLLELPGVDVVGDALEVLGWSLPDGSVRVIHSEHFLEHIPTPRVWSARLLACSGRVANSAPLRRT